MAKILLIEDEPDMQFILSESLGAEGHEVATASEGRQGAAMALAGGYDLVLLDIMLPDIDGFEVCKLIRAQNARVPVIMLTARAEEIDKVVGLEVGADDYVTKPFGMREFLARVKAALRRTGRLHAGNVEECTIGRAAVNFARRQLTVGHKRSKLTRYENDLLRFLAARRGRIVSREEILREVWNTDIETDNRTVDNYIARLRAKIEETPSAPRHILTMHGKGYKLA